MRFAVATVLFLFLSSISFRLTAQTSVSNHFKSLDKIEDNLLKINDGDWITYSGDDENILFIDFQKINANLKEILVRNRNKKIVFKDELWNLPVDSIYELDMSKYPKGFYQIKIKTFTSSIVKAIKVK